MLISPTREADRKTLADVMDILETATRCYSWMPKQELFAHIERLDKWADELREKVAHYDYQEEDARLMRLQRLYQSLK